MREVSVSSGTISTIAGNGVAAYTGDSGMAISAGLSHPYGLALGKSGNIYVADSGNNAVRLLTPASQPIVITAVVDSGSESAVPVSPGKIIVIYGSGLGPSQIAINSPVNGAFGSQLAGTTVSVRGVLAPIYYTLSTQVAVVVPYEITGATSASVVVSYQGQISNSFTVNFAASSPGLYTANATGAGQAAAINFADGMVNSASDPVKIGGFIELYATGEGQTTPAGVDQARWADSRRAESASHSDDRWRSCERDLQRRSLWRSRRRDAGQCASADRRHARRIRPRGPDRGKLIDRKWSNLDRRFELIPVLLTVMSKRLLLAATVCVATSWAQQYVISTVAGGSPLPTPVAAAAVPLGQILGVATDTAGNVYFSASNCVFKLDQSGNLTRAAGTARAGYSGDGGPATSAQLNSPGSIALDSGGDIFVADRNNERIRRISPTGIITTVAGNGNPIGTYTEGGPATMSVFSSIGGLAIDLSGDLFISDSGYSVVRKVSPKGIITTFAGVEPGYSGDGGPAVHARLNYPARLALDSAGNLYIADSGNNCVRKVATNGTITTFAGTGFAGYSGTAVWPSMHSCLIRRAWRWTLRATCSLPIRRMTAFARYRSTALFRQLQAMELPAIPGITVRRLARNSCRQRILRWTLRGTF